jgi:hypothetical protein
MGKKIVNIFFLLVFMIQVLPVKQVGRILFQASLIEELPEKGPSKTTGLEDETKNVLSFYQFNILSAYNSLCSYIHFSETLPGLMAGDVQTPPPNFS